MFRPAEGLPSSNGGLVDFNASFLAQACPFYDGGASPLLLSLSTLVEVWASLLFAWLGVLDFLAKSPPY